jgi:S-adenosylmethionine:tRNA ribosyltransferase-isomerase
MPYMVPNPKNIQIASFNYNLPDERIAKYPLEQRDLSRLLVYKAGNIEESTYKNLPNYLPNDSLLIFNNTKVVEARMLFHTFTGAVIELFYLEAVSDTIDSAKAMGCKGTIDIKCYVGNAKRWKHGPLCREVTWNGQTIEVIVSNKERVADYYHITLTWNPAEIVFAEILHAFGSIPLPPYLKRDTEASDLERYQTVFAKELGSVAAPTAGLHFTENIVEALNQKGIDTTQVTLHVGAGTFKPVKSDSIGEHEMHGEYLDVTVETIQKLKDSLDAKKIVTVGTTSMRTIESLYWLGRKVFVSPELAPEELIVGQWEPYEATELCSAKEALEALLTWLERNNRTSILSKTQIIIAPGYTFRIVDGLITNFHQPESTLLLLISALIGEDWKKVYDYALAIDFRFLSYGDGSLLWSR